MLHRSIALSSIAFTFVLAAPRGALALDPPSAAEPPRGVVTLRAALAAALVSSPTLEMYSWEVRAREAHALQAGLLPNPELGVEFENVGGSGDRQAFEQTETTIWLSQLLPLTGEPGKREHVADRERDLAEWDYQAARLHVLADTARAFVATLAAQERLALTGELERLAADSVRSVAERVRQGAASPVEQARLEVQHSSARLERTRVEHELAASRHALASSWGQAKPAFSSVRGELDELHPPPPLADLEAEIAATPELARWRSEVDRRRAALALERARGIPNPTVRLGGRRFEDNGDMALVFEVSLPLPVFDRNQGTVLAARRDIAKAKVERASAELALQTELAQRYQDLRSAYEQAKLLHEEVLPDARAAYESARSGYRQGRLLQLDVLDAHRTWFGLRAREVDVLASYHHARADVDEMSGRLLGRVPAEDVQ